jgi:hypothetical protein
MIYDAQDLADFEHCARIPGIRMRWEPDRWPVRDAVKRYVYGGLFADPEQVADDFLVEAAGRGFEYPESEPYELAKDYSSWIDGALRLLSESHTMDPLPPFEFQDDSFRVPGFLSETGLHVVRVVSELGNTQLRWPELLAFALGNYRDLAVHHIKLPSVRNRRLHSPLSLAFRNPLTGHFRLARRTKEKINFGPAWKRFGRWEVPEVGWHEWREGIDRDQCLSSIIDTYTQASPNTENKRRILNDIEHMLVSTTKNTHPRKWEMCETCTFKGVCHDGKRGFVRKNLQRPAVQRKEEVEVILS